MEYGNRPPLRIGATVAKWLLILILTTLGLSLLQFSRGEYRRYTHVYKRGVTVSGEAYRIEEEEDSEGDTDYYLRIRYTYGGREYNTRYPKTYASRASAEKLLGQMLEVTVNPDSPGEKISEIRASVRGTAIVSGLALSIACSCLFIRQRKYWFEVYGWRREYVLPDMQRKMRADLQTSVWLLTTGTWLITVHFMYAVVFEGFILFALGLAALILGGKQTKKQLRYRDAFRDGQYVFSRDTLVSKKMESDSDSTYYRLYYSGGQTAWHTNVSKKKYDAAREGDVAETVRFPWEKRPYLHCDRRNTVV